MPTLSLDENIEVALFDSFVKKVVRNAGINLTRKARKEQNIVLSDSDMIDAYGQDDIRFSENIIVDKLGHVCILTDEYLYEAMLLLTEKQLEVLAMEFWYGMCQKNIAKKLHISGRAVRLRRTQAFKVIRENYHGGYYGKN
ncbi:MAG: sigma factor-like helix-turn-helix DNA-binding protein [Oscillospiraceae bacterium]